MQLAKEQLTGNWRYFTGTSCEEEKLPTSELDNPALRNDPALTMVFIRSTQIT